RESITGLKICTRCRAISARRNRRISSSLFPENIGPTTTSIQPMLPFTMSTSYLLTPRPRATRCAVSQSGCGRLPVYLLIVEWRERRHHCHAKGFLPGDQVPGEHTPGPLRVANSHRSREPVDRLG